MEFGHTQLIYFFRKMNFDDYLKKKKFFQELSKQSHDKDYLRQRHSERMRKYRAKRKSEYDNNPPYIQTVVSPIIFEADRMYTFGNTPNVSARTSELYEN